MTTNETPVCGFHVFNLYIYYKPKILQSKLLTFLVFNFAAALAAFTFSKVFLLFRRVSGTPGSLLLKRIKTGFKLTKNKSQFFIHFDYFTENSSLIFMKFAKHILTAHHCFKIVLLHKQYSKSNLFSLNSKLSMFISHLIAGQQ